MFNSAENTRLTFDHSVCGRTVANSTNSRLGTAPWNVGVYKYNNDEGVYEMICGGSLIGPNLVVSGENSERCAFSKIFIFKTVFLFFFYSCTLFLGGAQRVDRQRYVQNFSGKVSKRFFSAGQRAHSDC